MMRCEEARLLASSPRDLGDDRERDLAAHLSSCAACAEFARAVRRQDAALGAVRTLSAPAGLYERVIYQAQRSVVRSSLAVVRPVALTALLLLALSYGTVRAAEGSLPGDVLYPVKRAVERAALHVATDAETRDALAQQFENRRIEEVGDLLRRGRQGEVSFKGIVKGGEGDVWLVEGLPVVVPLEDYGECPPNGAEVHVRARVEGGILQAEEVMLLSTPAGAAAPADGPEATRAQEGNGDHADTMKPAPLQSGDQSDDRSPGEGHAAQDSLGPTDTARPQTTSEGPEGKPPPVREATEIPAPHRTEGQPETAPEGSGQDVSDEGTAPPPPAPSETPAGDRYGTATAPSDAVDASPRGHDREGTPDPTRHDARPPADGLAPGATPTAHDGHVEDGAPEGLRTPSTGEEGGERSAGR